MMKNLFNAAIRGQFKTVTEQQLTHQFTWNTAPLFYVIVLLSTFLFTGCKKYEKIEANSEAQSMSNKKINDDKELLTYYKGLDPRTLWELQQARAATARYSNINNAFGDQYKDIGLVMQNMGFHFLKAELIDSVFDFRKPELLVYNKKANGSFELVALEYAVPIDPQNPNTPPEGFTGNADEWDFNTLNSGWWTLHAWVWENNPDGVFNMTNPLVIVPQ
jgi:hypothetical protein